MFVKVEISLFRWLSAFVYGDLNTANNGQSLETVGRQKYSRIFECVDILDFENIFVVRTSVIYAHFVGVTENRVMEDSVGEITRHFHGCLYDMLVVYHIYMRVCDMRTCSVSLGVMFHA